MTLQVHELHGTAPEPLALYLKGLGIVRLLAEQKDPQVRAFWRNERICLLTSLDRPALEAFFLEEYAPTPCVSPWNKDSGFFKGDDSALVPIERSQAPRFDRFRAGIAAGRAGLAKLSAADAEVRAIKDRAKKKKGETSAQAGAAQALKHDAQYKQELAAADRRFKELKSQLFAPYLRTWRGPHRCWLDAAMVWLDGEGKPAWPSLLGTGGNDGRFDFTYNAMQRLATLFDMASPAGSPRPGAAELLREALWAAPSNRLDLGAAIGQFLPGSAGGANSANGPGGDSLVNPWDFVLMLEGTILLSARATRRLDPASLDRASAPFAVRSHAAGYATPGREDAQRGEQWLPLWTQPTDARALQAMLGEGRMQLGRQVAHQPLDVARAIARLGVARGISAFTRFGYLQRNGQSTIAVPLGRIEVRSRPKSRLIDDIAPWLDRLHRLAKDGQAPARLVAAEGVLASGVLASLTHDDSPQRWQTVLISCAAIETIQAGGTAFRAGPLPRLTPAWLEAADDGSVEWRVATALGSAAAKYTRHGCHDPVRSHCLPLRPQAERFLEKDQRLSRDPRVVVTRRDPVADLGAIVLRRLIEATQRGQRKLPLVAAPGYEAHPTDLAAVLAGSVDLERVVGLGRALMAVRWSDPLPARRAPLAGMWPEEGWMAVRLTCLPGRLDAIHAIPVETAIVRRLLAGDGASALEIALRRLAAAGLRPPLQGGCAQGTTAHLWAAALAFPISRATARAMARRFLPTRQ